MNLLRTHHVAVICSDYAVSRRFYTEVLGLEIVAEAYRAARDSHKLDLRLPDGTQIELFSFPNPPKRTKDFYSTQNISQKDFNINHRRLKKLPLHLSVSQFNRA